MVRTQDGFRGVYAEYPKESIEYCDQAVSLTPNDAEVYLYRSLVSHILYVGTKQQQSVTGEYIDYMKYYKQYKNDFAKALKLGCPDISIKIGELYDSAVNECYDIKP